MNLFSCGCSEGEPRAMGTAQAGPSHLLKVEEEVDVLRRGTTGPNVSLSFAPLSLHEVPRNLSQWEDKR